jgi:pimeloyl-ACP methyl ester carboxylesterase
MREIVESTIGGARLVGTLHRPDPAVASERSVGDVGVLLMSPGHVARAGSGDLFPRLADALAGRGFPVLRFDFPGLGDSFGAVPELELEYFRFIQGGGNLEFARALVQETRQRLDLRGLVVGGLCGGSVTAMFATDRCPDGVLGLVLLDPDFSLSSTTDTSEPEQRPSRFTSLLRKLAQPRTWLRIASGESRLGNLGGPLRSVLLGVSRRMLGESLPRDTNFELVEACRRLSDRGLPMFMITARGGLREMYLDQVEKVALGGARSSQTTRLSMQHTNHVFTAGGASSVLIDEVCGWVATRWANGS